MKLHHTGDYQAKRERDYPSVGDQLDAIWKALEPGKANLPKEARDMVERVQGVKQKFPKAAK
jgi:hypothetical protein